MASKRLNGRLREVIRRNVLEEAFGSRHEAHQQRQEVIGDEIYASVLGEREQAMKQLPAGFFDLDCRITVIIHYSATDRKERHYVPLSTERLMPAYTRYGSDLTKLKDGDPLAQRLLALEEEQKRIDDAKSQMTEKLRSVLSSVATLASLVRIWPEVVGYLPTETPVEITNNLPVVIVDDINKAIAMAKAA
jgi:hypothetical protein